ncbi:AAA family ATPase [Ferrimonas lipolytica]|uniref:ATP-binding protein n=1 Tax=Ferrimonas lipolytica TaxID=2724191 RepID=A0A6H1UIT7_9GAMM|nr:ATP-binding protein [Ferrimonas lipolytica]QIZ77712.1 ATP-binding protein [Ferrimonas lipolytica]
MTQSQGATQTNAQFDSGALQPLCADLAKRILDFCDGDEDALSELKLADAKQLFLLPESLQKNQFKTQIISAWQRDKLILPSATHNTQSALAAIGRVATELKLSALEHQILELIVITALSAPLQSMLAGQDGEPLAQLAGLSGINKQILLELFEQQPILVQLDWLKQPQSSSYHSFEYCIQLDESEAWSIVNYPGNQLLKLLVPTMQTVTDPAHLPLTAFDEDTATLCFRYLQGAQQQGQPGANILLFGPPGTGKTSFSCTLANALKRPLFSIDSISVDLDSTELCNGNKRLRDMSNFYRLQGRHTNGLLLIDECEDLFPESLGNRDSVKAKLHPLLESNPLPAIWITNEILDIPDSCLRRFGLVLELKPGNCEFKLRRFRKISRGLRLSQKFLLELAKEQTVTVGHLSKYVQSAKLAMLSGRAAESFIGNQLSTILQLSKQKPKPTYQPAVSFNPAVLNYNGPALEKMLPQVQKIGQANLLLEGPPGTGKTALAHYIAQQLSRPIVAKTASDLLDKYVGGTETKLAQAFAAARQSRAILLLDEIDSLLSDRHGHQHSWETTQVNELLVQIERFDGILIASTNFAEHLDPAVRRRFDAVLQFDYLTKQAIRTLFTNQFGPQAYGKHQRALDSLSFLTTGDFAVIRRRIERLEPDLSAEQALIELTVINKNKGHKAPVGFVA